MTGNISNRYLFIGENGATGGVGPDNSAQIQSLEQDLSIFQTNYTSTSSELANAQVEQSNISSEMTTTQQAVETAQQNLTNAQTSLSNAQSALSSAQGIAGVEIQNEDGSISMDYSARDAAIAQAQAQVDAAQAQVTAAQAELTAAEQAQTQAQQRYDDIVADIDAFEAELVAIDADIFSTQAEITNLQQQQEPVIPINQEEETIGGLTKEEMTEVQDTFVGEINKLISEYYPDKSPEEITDAELEQMLFLEGIKDKTADMQGTVEAYYATEGWADDAYNWLKDATGKGITRKDVDEYVENENFKNIALEVALKNGTINVVDTDAPLTQEEMLSQGAISKETINEIIYQKMETLTSVEEVVDYATSYLSMSEEEVLKSIKTSCEQNPFNDFEIRKNDEGKYIVYTGDEACAFENCELNDYLEFYDYDDFVSNISEQIVSDYTNKEEYTFEEMYSFFTGVEYSPEAIQEVADMQPVYNSAMSTYMLASNQEEIFANASSPFEVLEYFEEVYDCSREESIQMFNAYYENVYENMNEDGEMLGHLPTRIVSSGLKLSEDGKTLTVTYSPVKGFKKDCLPNSSYVYDEESNTVTCTLNLTYTNPVTNQEEVNRYPSGDVASLFRNLNAITDENDYGIKDAVEGFNTKYGEEYGSFDDVIKNYNEAYSNAYGNNILNEKFNVYQADMDSYAAKLSGGISTVGFALSFVNPAFGYVALAGAYTDNAIDLVNLSTNQVEDEFGAWALDTGKDVLLTAMGMKLGKVAAGAGERHTANLLKKGMDFSKAKAWGVAREVGIDFATGYAMDAGVALASLYMQDGKLDMEKYTKALKDNIMGNLMSCGMDIRGGIAAYRAINASKGTGGTFSYEYKDGSSVSYDKEFGTIVRNTDGTSIVHKNDGSMVLIGKDNQRYKFSKEEAPIAYELKQLGYSEAEIKNSSLTKESYENIKKMIKAGISKETALKWQDSNLKNLDNNIALKKEGFSDESIMLVTSSGVKADAKIALELKNVGFSDDVALLNSNLSQGDVDLVSTFVQKYPEVIEKGLSPEVIARNLNENMSTRSGMNLTEEQRSTILALRMFGFSEQIANASYMIPENQVRMAMSLKNAGLSENDAVRYCDLPQEHIDDCVKMINAGFSKNTINSYLTSPSDKLDYAIQLKTNGFSDYFALNTSLKTQAEVDMAINLRKLGLKEDTAINSATISQDEYSRISEYVIQNPKIVKKDFNVSNALSLIDNNFSPDIAFSSFSSSIKPELIEIAVKLRDVGFDEKTALICSKNIKDGNIETAKMLFEKGFNPQVATKYSDISESDLHSILNFAENTNSDFSNMNIKNFLSLKSIGMDEQKAFMYAITQTSDINLTGMQKLMELGFSEEASIKNSNISQNNFDTAKQLFDAGFTEENSFRFLLSYKDKVSDAIKLKKSDFSDDGVECLLNTSSNLKIDDILKLKDAGYSFDAISSSQGTYSDEDVAMLIDFISKNGEKVADIELDTIRTLKETGISDENIILNPKFNLVSLNYLTNIISMGFSEESAFRFLNDNSDTFSPVDYSIATELKNYGFSEYASLVASTRISDTNNIDVAMKLREAGFDSVLALTAKDADIDIELAKKYRDAGLDENNALRYSTENNIENQNFTGIKKLKELGISDEKAVTLSQGLTEELYNNIKTLKQAGFSDDTVGKIAIEQPDKIEKAIEMKEVGFEDSFIFQNIEIVNSEKFPVIIALKEAGVSSDSALLRCKDMNIDKIFQKQDVIDNINSLSTLDNDVKSLLVEFTIFGNIDLTSFDLRKRISLQEKMSEFRSSEEYKLIYQNNEETDVSINRFISLIDNSLSGNIVPVDITDAELKAFAQGFLANNNETVETTLKTTDFTQFGKNGIPLEYSRSEFIADLNKQLENCDERQKQAILQKIGITLTSESSGYNGILDYTKLDLSNPVEKEVYGSVYKFLKENKVQTGDGELDSVLNSLIAGMPEFINVVGKQQHATQNYSVDTHILTVLQNAMSHPDYENLSDIDKTALKLATMLHDIAKSEGIVDEIHPQISSLYAQDILSKLPFDSQLKDRVVELVSNHHWLEAYNTGTASSSSVAVSFRRSGDLAIARIMAESDLKGVSESFYKLYGSSLDEGKQIPIDEAFTKMNETGQLLFTSKVVKSDLIPTVEYNGKEYKVMDFTSLPVGSSLEEFGFAPDTTRESMRLFVHMNDNGASGLETVNLLTNMNNGGFLCASYISLDNKPTYWNQKFGVSLQAENVNVANASGGNQSSGYGKGYEQMEHIVTNELWRDLIPSSIKKELGLTDTQYSDLYSQISGKQYLSQIRDNDVYTVGDKSFTGEQVRLAIKKANDVIITGRQNEANLYVPKINAFVAKVDSIEEIPQDYLDFAQAHNLPIYLLGS